jgi:hypothetical protein
VETEMAKIEVETKLYDQLKALADTAGESVDEYASRKLEAQMI